MSIPLKIDVFDYSDQIVQQTQTLQPETNNSRKLEQNITAIYMSKIETQASINTYSIKASSKPRQLRGKYTKHLPLIKERALTEICFGASINQVSKKYDIKYSTLRNWTKRSTIPTLLYHEFFALLAHSTN